MLRFTDGAVYAEGSASRHTTTDKPLKNNPEHSMLGIVSYEVSSMECFRFCRAAWGLWGTGARPALVLTNPKWRSEVAGQQNFIPWQLFRD